MKKIFIVLLAAFVFAVINPTKSEAVRYDGAEVFKDQTGKMTFTKDIKIYKKNEDGTFDSLVVKRNNYFKTYEIEKYDGKTFYQMGPYRVQATNLVVFKEIPMKIRASFYPNVTYININRNSGEYGKLFQVTEDSEAKTYPLVGSKTEKAMPKGSMVYSVSDSINAYLCVKEDLEANDEQCTWLPVGILKPIY